MLYCSLCSYKTLVNLDSKLLQQQQQQRKAAIKVKAILQLLGRIQNIVEGTYPSLLHRWGHNASQDFLFIKKMNHAGPHEQCLPDTPEFIARIPSMMV
eukprot:899488-Ditylum_brightwellii.AAC.1